MLEQAIDFRDESDALFEILAPLSDADFETPTLFKTYTIHDVVAHLHIWNWAADTSLSDEAAFMDFLTDLQEKMAGGQTLIAFTDDWLKGARGRAVLDAWRDHYPKMGARWVDADPKQRLKWAGPDMSARSSITARLMETWAHGQEVYDVLGHVRKNGDRIKNIAFLGINTFGWTFVNRGQDVPPQMPYVRLNAPSGDVWEWGASDNADRIEGDATEFCQVVTQVRNIADTKLKVSGPVATQWMAIGQCFAGQPEDPPPPGTRFTKR